MTMNATILLLSIVFGRGLALSFSCPKSTLSDVITLKGQTNNQCYVYVSTAVAQDSAIEECRSSFKGFLARISSRSELSAVVSRIQNVHRDHIWVDIKYNTVSGNATWSDGTFIGNEMLNQKVTSSSSTMCGALKNVGTTRYTSWTTISCVLYNGFICQTPAIVTDETAFGNRSFVYNGLCYSLTETLTDYSESEAVCKARGGALASLASQGLIIAATNYLNLYQNSIRNIWVKSVRRETLGPTSSTKYPPSKVEILSHATGILMTKDMTSNTLLDRHTTWFWYSNDVLTTTAYTLCETVPGAVVTTEPIVATASTPTTNASTPTNPITPASGINTTVLTAVLVVTFFVVLVVLFLLFCCNNSACFQTVLGRRKRNKKEKTLIIPPQPHGRTSLQTNGSLLPDNRANEFHTIADARPLDDLNTYNQITSDVASEALYASIDNVQPYAVSNVQETYAEIDNPLVFTTSGEARRTDIAAIGMKSRPRLHAQVRSPESTNKDSRMNSAPTQSSTDTAHRKLRNGEGPSSSAPGYLSPIPCTTCSPSVQYAELSLAADEEEEISYAKLLLNDEEDYYKHLIDNNHGIALKPTSPTVSVQSSQKNSSSLKRTSDVDSGLAEEGVLSPSQE